jgi:prepilin-type N-terminal cleavage/methylation domain-containing protein
MAIANFESQISNQRMTRSRRGMTLIELLVVVTILLLAAALFVPRLKPMMDHSKVREAARVVQLYLNTARNVAMTSGRSCGVMIEPLITENGCSMTLHQMETPPPFGGDFLGQTALTLAGTANGTVFPTIVGPYAIVPILFEPWQPGANPPYWPSVPLYEGDQIQLGYQGFWYNVAPTNSNGIVPNTSIALNKQNATAAAQPTMLSVQTAQGNQSMPCLFIYLDISHGELPSFFTPGAVTSYKIRRWPTKSATKALQLPATTCIDLTASGSDPATLTTSATWSTAPPASPPVLMFAPDGTVDRNYLLTIPNPNQPNQTQYKASVPVTPIYLLVGMRNKVNPPNPKDANLNDFNSLWISIDPSSGLVLITDPAAIPTDPTKVIPADYWSSRDNARKAMANGGGK